jgi:hypothetical protein
MRWLLVLKCPTSGIRSLSLSESGDAYEADLSDFDLSIWRDEDYLKFFEEETKKNHDVETATVLITGTEFKDCEVFVAKDKNQQRSYILVDEDLVPLSFKKDIVAEEDASPREDWVLSWLARMALL